ncbi:hypothetical protein DNTS_022057 [Danionella cerebrum]|uniref:Uncharacterized protein n=1 Tax=Danionella cerebrum TaxID=2873325 RepID=A0A553PYU0_9TELE|nr:hypothetical protein DNTS_022057 [Danionella translucida]
MLLFLPKTLDYLAGGSIILSLKMSNPAVKFKKDKEIIADYETQVKDLKYLPSAQAKPLAIVPDFAGQTVSEHPWWCRR